MIAYPYVWPLLIPILAGVAFLFFAMRARRAGEIDPRKKLARRLRFALLGFGGSLVCLMFLLPSTPALATFGYPQTVDDVSDPKKVLRYLQWYNREIVRTAEVVYWAIFIGVFLTGASVEAALREFAATPVGAVTTPPTNDETTA